MKINTFADSKTLFEGLANRMISIINEALQNKGKCYIAISGGRTPKPFLEYLAQQSSMIAVWKNCHFFLTDERYVPHTSDDSNFKMINDALLKHIDIPQENIHDMKTDISPVEVCAKQYADDISNTLQSKSFDFMLMGIGPDGHYASIFPNVQINEDVLATESYAPHLQSWRITMTPQVFYNAKNVVFIVQGDNKANILKDVFSKKPSADFPVNHLVSHCDVDWYIDNAAASLLKK